MTSAADPAAMEPHELDEGDFYGHVQTFSYWFETVEGYLHDRPDGYDPDLTDEELLEDDHEGLITTLCNYCVGESAALEASSGMVAIAPNHNSQIFMATQVADEARHLEVFLRRLAELGVDDPQATVERRANKNLVAFKARLLELVAAGDWDAAVFAQNVVLETMEFTVFRFHKQLADPVTRQILEGVIYDERRHLGFGENDLGRSLSRDPDLRQRLQGFKREFDYLVLGAFDGVYEDLGLDRDNRPDLGRDYLEAVDRLGFA